VDPNVPKPGDTPRLPADGETYFDENFNKNLASLIVHLGLMKILGLPLAMGHVSLLQEMDDPHNN
jgi:hypothetical protein